MTHIENEKHAVEKMIRLYCRHKEGNKVLCDECRALIEYAHTRLDHCRYGEDKPTCRKCPIHCYRPEMRKRIKVIMRYSGPRMMIYDPKTAVEHLWREMTRKSNVKSRKNEQSDKSI